MRLMVKHFRWELSVIELRFVWFLLLLATLVPSLCSQMDKIKAPPDWVGELNLTYYLIQDTANTK